MGGDFWRLWSAASLSNLGDGIGRVAVPLLGASLTRDPVLVAGLTSLSLLPWLVLGIPAGLLVDRVERRTLMVVSNLVRAGALAALCAGLLSDAVGIGWLYGAVFVLGAAEVVYDTAALAAVPALVPGERLDGANAWLTAGETTTQLFLGAPIASLLFAVAAALPFGVNAAAFVLSVLLIASLPRFSTRREPAVARAAWSARRARRGVRATATDVGEGLTWLWRHRRLRVVLLVASVTGFAEVFAQSTLVLLALEELGIRESAFGFYAAVAGAGAVVGAWAAPRLGRRMGRGVVLAGVPVVAAVALVSIGLSPGPFVFAAAYALSGAAIAVWNVLSMSLRQQLIPGHLFGRVQGAYRTVLYGVMPVAAWCGGLVASGYGLRAPWILAAVLDLLIVAVAGHLLVRSDRAARVSDPAADDAASGDAAAPSAVPPLA